MEKIIALIVLLIVGTFIVFGHAWLGLLLLGTTFLAFVLNVAIKAVFPLAKKIYAVMPEGWLDIPKVIDIAEEKSVDINHDNPDSIVLLYMLIEQRKDLFEIKINKSILKNMKKNNPQWFKHDNVSPTFKSKRSTECYNSIVQEGSPSDYSKIRKAILVRRKN